MSTAEQMGRVLQRTAISTNIKERLDFSCALFGPDGGLVANAPHIPVHLGAMQATVQHQLRHLPGGFNPGDVVLVNHPQAGGSHLPDLTVITPVRKSTSNSSCVHYEDPYSLKDKKINDKSTGNTCNFRLVVKNSL